MKGYKVSFDLICSHDVDVKAKTAHEAMDKALKRLAPKLKRKSYWRIDWKDENGKCGGREGKGY